MTDKGKVGIIGVVSILGINTATNNTEVALVERERVIFNKAWRSNYDEASKVLPALLDALKKGKKTPEKIFVVQGPGSFTGLRIGITMANTLAFALGVPLTTCNTFEYLEKKMSEKYVKSTAIVLRAGGEFVAVRLPAKKNHKIFTVTQMVRLLKKNKIRYVVSDLKKDERSKINLPEGASWMPEKSLKSLAVVMQGLIKEKIPEHKIVKPQYLKPPQITTSKKQVFVKG